MNPHLPKRMTRATMVVLTAIATAGAVAVAGGAASASASGGASAAPVTNPYSPAYQHSYRHGAVPTRSTEVKMRQWASSHPHAAPNAGTAANDLNYGGGIDGIGVTTGPEKVYLVFYGSQWGTQSTNANGDVTLSGDPSGEAPYLQEFMKGLGTN